MLFAIFLEIYSEINACWVITVNSHDKVFFSHDATVRNYVV